MSNLTAAQRKKLPKAKFAGPGRRYPVPDRAHAGNAKARASGMFNMGRISKSTRDRIYAKANSVLSK